MCLEGRNRAYVDGTCVSARMFAMGCAVGHGHDNRTSGDGRSEAIG
jgi:hypothetical protein